jgi:hypothetical protein
MLLRYGVAVRLHHPGSELTIWWSETYGVANPRIDKCGSGWPEIRIDRGLDALLLGNRDLYTSRRSQR